MNTTIEPVEPETKQRPTNGLVAALRPLVIDVGIPAGGYYLLHAGFGLGVVPSLILSGVVPAARTVFGVVRERRLNGLAGLMVVVNLVGIAASLITGDPRLMIAKDGAISSAIAIGILASVVLGRPLMTAGLKPIITKGNAAKTAAWDRLAESSTRFGRLEKAFSIIWGVVLLSECVVRVILAYTLPVSTMVWLSGVLVAGAIGLAIIIGAPVTGSVEKLVTDEQERTSTNAQTA